LYCSSIQRNVTAIAEHSKKLGHRIKSHTTSILAKKLRYVDHIIRETIEIELHPNNINRENGFSLSRSWKPLIHDLWEQKTGSKQGHNALQ
jgi:hypothetical protein